MKSINHFLIDLNKSASKLFIWTGAHKKEVLGESRFLIGYKTMSNKLQQSDDGEYIEISIKERNIEVKNDPYGTYPVYVWDMGDRALFSDSISILSEYSPQSLSIDSDLLYEYFTIGYSILGRSLYKDISYLQPSSKLQVSNSYKVFQESKGTFLDESELDLNGLEEISEAFCDSILKKLPETNHESSTFGLTSGHDSLLGSLFLNLLEIKMDIVTMGKIDSGDMIHGKLRKKKFFNDSNHITFQPKNLNITVDDFKKIAQICGGMTTLGAVSLYKMQKILKDSYNKRYFYDCTHFEILRKKLVSEDVFLEKYTTPNNVINNIFRHPKAVSKLKKEILKDINDHYGERALEKFYHFDRNVHGQNYKSLILNDLEGLRICIIHDQNLLKKIIKSRFYSHSDPYWGIIDNLESMLSIDLSTEKKSLLNSQKSLAFNNLDLIDSNKEFFLTLLESDLALELDYFFDIQYLKDCVSTGSLSHNEDWFLLRFSALLAFGLQFKVGVS